MPFLKRTSSLVRFSSALFILSPVNKSTVGSSVMIISFNYNLHRRQVARVVFNYLKNACAFKCMRLKAFARNK